MSRARSPLHHALLFTLAVGLAAVSLPVLSAAPASATPDPPGTVTTVAGNGNLVRSGDGGPAIAAGLGVDDVFVDRRGNIYFVEANDWTIRRVDGATGVISTVAGNGTYGASPDGARATDGGLQISQTAVAADAAGNVYFVESPDLGDVVRRVDGVTGVLSTVAGGQLGAPVDGVPATASALYSPTDLAVDSVGNVYIADGFDSAVRKVDVSTGIITSVAGSVVNWPNIPSGYAGDGGPATQALLGPIIHGVAIDPSDNLYILDSNQSVHGVYRFGPHVRRVDAGTGTGIITTVAGGGNGDGTSGSALGVNLDGQANPQAENGALAQYATSIAADGAGHLFIASTTGFQNGAASGIWTVDLAAGTISVSAGQPIPGFAGDGGPATAAQFDDIRSISATAAGDLYLADARNFRTRRISAAPPAVGPAVSVSAEASNLEPIAGAAPVDVTLTARDAAGSPVPGQLIYLSFSGAAVAPGLAPTPGSIVVAPTTVTTDATGRFHFALGASAPDAVGVYASFTPPGTTLMLPTLLIEFGGLPSVDAPATFTVAAGSPYTIPVTVHGVPSPVLTTLGSGANPLAAPPRPLLGSLQGVAPAAVGTYQFTVQAANRVGTVPLDVTLVVVPAASRIVQIVPAAPSWPSGSSPLDVSVIVTDGLGNPRPGVDVTLSASGSAQVDPGVFRAATPTDALGVAHFALTDAVAEDVILGTNGDPTVTAAVTFTAPPSFGIRVEGSVRAGAPYVVGPNAGGFPVPVVSIEGIGSSPLPAGLLPVWDGQRFSGVAPTVAGVYGYRVTASNSVGSVSYESVLVVLAASPVSYSIRPSVPVGAAGGAPVEVVVHLVDPFGNLVTGQSGMIFGPTLTASGSARVTGLDGLAVPITGNTPDANGDLRFLVSDAVGEQVTLGIAGEPTVTATLTFVTPLTISTASLPQARVGLAYSQQLTGAGGLAPYSWSLAAGSALPAGLTLSSGGLVSGTPTASGTFPTTVVLTDGRGPTSAVQKTFSLVVAPAAASGPADLVMAVTASPFVSGASATLTMKVTNVGGAPATGPLLVTNVLPVGFASAAVVAPSGWACTVIGRLAACATRNSLAAGAAATITVSGRVTSARGATVTDTAAVLPPTSDPTPANDSATLAIKVL